MPDIISESAIATRKYWIEEVRKLSGHFANDADRLHKELGDEVQKKGFSTLVDHLRLCGSIPESYKHDSSEEKLYSKYTDSLLSYCYTHIGFKSLVLTERADAADVEIFGDNYDFVADAKAFRLSRTAKNQKDFKVQAMDGWRGDKKYAMVVCPIYQLPSKSSQIYHQATTRNVCVFTYSHLSLLINYSEKEGNTKTQELLHKVFNVISALSPSKYAIDYWLAINKTMLEFSDVVEGLWKVEKEAATESTLIAKKEGLLYLAQERSRIMRMSHDEALKELIKMKKIENKIKVIERVSDSGLFGIK